MSRDPAFINVLPDWQDRKRKQIRKYPWICKVKTQIFEKTMDNDTIHIDSAKSHVICKHKQWIERLFNVQLNICGNEKSNENEVIQSHTCQVAAQTADAPKNVDKAKV